MNSTLTTRPITLRWDQKLTTPTVRKLQFPLNAHNQVESASLIDLIQDCEPATFGYRGNDILDDSYRNALKMDCSKFSVDFCPYESGIIDNIAQLLVPNSDSSTLMSGVQAELYKLNVRGMQVIKKKTKKCVDLHGSFRLLQSTCGYSTLRAAVWFSCRLSALLSPRGSANRPPCSALNDI